MNLSCVILTWNSEKYINKCLSSLISELNKIDASFEIYIVDNGSRDKTTYIIDYYKKKYPQYIIPIFLDRNTGTTYSRNLALKRAEGEFIIIMDSDVEVLPGSVNRLIQSLNKNRKAAIVAPRILYPNGRLQKSTDVFPTILTKIYRYFFLKRIEEKSLAMQSSQNLLEVDYAISALWILRHQICDMVGFLDENIIYAPEDVDFCLRVWKAGYKVLYDPNALCIHHAQEISRGLKINIAMLWHIHGLLYYFWKHKYLFKRPDKIVV
ncbi:MAG: glycosyltransferase family 2 protein [bacterium]